MINKLKELMVRTKAWPEEAQELLVRSAFDIELHYLGRYELTEADRAALERSAADVENGRFASEREVEEVFARFRQARGFATPTLLLQPST